MAKIIDFAVWYDWNMKSLEFKLYLYSFLSDFMVIYSLFALYIEKQGLTNFQITSLFLVWTLTALILEVPSGIWADIFSRKWLLAFAEVIRILGWLIWLVWPTYAGFLIGFICWGVKNAAVSGTFQALTFDELKKNGLEGRYLKIIGTTGSLGLGAIVCGTLLASQLISFGYQFIIISSILTGILAAAVILTVPAVHQYKKVEQNYFKVFRNSIEQVKSNYAVRVILIVTFAGAVFGGIGNYATLYFKDAGLSESAVSITYSILALTMALFSALAYKFKKASLLITISLLSLSGGFLVLSGYFLNLAGVIFYISWASVSRLFVVLMDGKLQNAITSEERATITSFKGFLDQAAFVLLYFSFVGLSWGMSRTDSFKVYGIGMILISIGSLIFFSLRKRLLNSLY